MMVKLDMMLLQAKAKMRAFFTKENGDVNVVSIVVLIGIALVLAVFFRNEIEKIIKKLFQGITGNVDKATADMG